MAALSERSIEFVEGMSRDVWEGIGPNSEVSGVVVMLLLDEGGFSADVSARVADRWIEFQLVDSLLATPIGSAELNRSLVRAWRSPLLGGMYQELISGDPRATRVTVTSTSAEDRPVLDVSTYPFWGEEESPFQVLEDWSARLKETGDTSAQW